MESSWTELKLGEVINLKRGYDLPASKRKVGKIPIMSSSGINGYHNEEKVKGPGVITGRSGQLGKVFYIEDDYWPLNTTLYVENFKNNYPKYVYYLLQTLNFEKFNAGSSVPTLNRNHVHKLEIKIPAHNIQKKIANILYMIDEKIQLNKEIVKKLDEISQTLFKHWFIDFEFPNEEGKPYKSSGGEMVGSELGDIPNLFNIGILADIYQNFDSKRKPLSKMERLKREKVYPYYGAASLMDFVDDYLFDGIYLLLGEDGTVQTKEGYPVLQLVDGKFWVNNHAHVMQGATGFLTEYLYIMLKNINIKNIITGAVQPKISQRNLNNIKIIIPDEKSIEAFQKNIKLIFEEILNLRKENKNLTQLRDTLLPKLLSGEIEIPDDLEV